MNVLCRMGEKYILCTARAVRFHSTPTGMRPENWQGEPTQTEFEAKANL
jgi:hypothetical protein